MSILAEWKRRASRRWFLAGLSFAALSFVVSFFGVGIGHGSLVIAAAFVTTLSMTVVGITWFHPQAEAGSTCAKCGYALLGTKRSSLCPECGTPWTEQPRGEWTQLMYAGPGLVAFLAALALLLWLIFFVSSIWTGAMS